MSNIKLNKIFKTVCIASDHAGYNLKEVIKDHLVNKNVSIFDLGPMNDNRVDYPDFAERSLIIKSKKAMWAYLFVVQVPEWLYQLTKSKKLGCGLL